MKLLKTDKLLVIATGYVPQTNQKVRELLCHVYNICLWISFLGVKHHNHVLQKGFWQCKVVGLKSRSTSAWQIMGEAQVVRGLKKARGRVQKKRHMSLWTVASFSLYSQMQERSMIKYFGTVCCVSVTLIQNYHVCIYCTLFKLNVVWDCWRGHLLAYNWLSYEDFCLLHSL